MQTISERTTAKIEPDLETRRNGVRVDQLAELCHYGEGKAANIPSYLLEVIKTHAWRKFYFRFTETTFEYGPDEFDRFARAKAPAGLDVERGIAGLIHLCRSAADETNDPAAKAVLPKLRELLEAGKDHGGDRKSEAVKNQGDVITLNGRGTSEAYLIARLKKKLGDKDPLLKRYYAGEITARAAAIGAGILKPVVQVSPTVSGFVRAIEKHLSADDRCELKRQL